MKVTKLTSKKLLLEFPTRKEQNLTMFRLSEFSEGDPILQKYYTPDIFIDFWSDDKGDINYWSYWEGFNVSKKDIIKFAMEFKGNVSKRELSVIEQLKNIEDDGYIISMVEGDVNTLKHEMSHSYYFEDENYRNQIIEVMNSIPDDIINRYKKHLIDMKYNESVLNDEMHAYLVAYDQEEWDECFPEIKREEIQEYSDKLNNIYEKLLK